MVERVPVSWVEAFEKLIDFTRSVTTAIDYAYDLNFSNPGTYPVEFSHIISVLEDSLYPELRNFVKGLVSYLLYGTVESKNLVNQSYSNMIKSLTDIENTFKVAEQYFTDPRYVTMLNNVYKYGIRTKEEYFIYTLSNFKAQLNRLYHFLSKVVSNLKL